MTADQINIVFKNYPVFRIGRLFRFITGSSIVKQSVFIGVFFTALIVVATLLDRTLVLPGRNVGVFEHPTVWAFLVIQIIAPYFVVKSVEKLFSFFEKNDVIDGSKALSGYRSFFKKQVSRQSNFSKFSFALLTIIGVICFVWNTLQNQQPYRFLGFDFWDSYNHPFGYWVTRLHKLYLWILFLPVIIHIQICILHVLYKLLKDAEREKFFTLRPYNQDEHAGVGEIIKIAINPPLPILLVGSLSVLGAFFIHGQIGVTPIIGLAIVSTLFLIVYLIPAIQLRRIIKLEKKRQLTEIAQKQNTLYFELVAKNKQPGNTDDLEILNSLTSVFEQVKSISVWPYWKRIAGLVGLINIPIIVSLAKAAWPFIKIRFF